MTTELHTDIAIIGGGIAGLWILNRLRHLGYNAVLIEKHKLGSDQTIASQGMIHGGIKYTLAASLSGSSEVIAAMPEIWSGCIAGKSVPDLSGARVLSRQYYMWSDDSLSSKLTSFLGSKALRGRVSKLSSDAYPDGFDKALFSGSLYELGDLVLDVHSLVTVLADRHSKYIFKSNLADKQMFRMNQPGHLESVVVSPELTIRSSRYLLTAGAGNENILACCNLESPAMQRRPLHQVLVKHDYPHPIYAHCVHIKSGSKPRLTITSHRSDDGRWIWYIGGALAESGVKRNEKAQIEFARKEISEALPWINLGHTEWRTLRIDRAEPQQINLSRPDNPFVKPFGNMIVVWPIKLTLTPAVSEQIETLFSRQGFSPSPSLNQITSNDFARPEIATPIWDKLFS
jgi:hypothetical protein